MSVDWPVVTIDKISSKEKFSCVGGPFGSSLSRKHYVDEQGVPVIRGTNLNGDKFIDDGFVYVSEEKGNELHRNMAYPGEIVFTQRGTLGQVAIIPNNATYERYVVSQSQMKLKVDDAIADPYYVYSFFRTKRTKDEIANRAIIGGVPHINLGILKSFEIPLPPLEVQKKISHNIKALDDKIELNRQTNQTLEQIAQAIFKSWFVDFEPTRAKIAAKQRWLAIHEITECSSPTCYAEELDSVNEHSNLKNQSLDEAMTQAAMAAISGKSIDELAQLSPDQRQQLKETATLFPDALVESDLGEIPVGWEVRLNGDVMDVRDGTHDSPKQSETGFPLVTSKHITSGVLVIKDAYLISEEDYEKVNKRSKVNQGDILLTMIGTVGIPYLVTQPNVNFAIKNVGLFRTSNSEELRHYFYLLLKSSEMQAYLSARMAGTTQKYLSLKTLRAIEMLLPSGELLKAFNLVVNPLMSQIFTSLNQNESLSDLRDCLLPKLLSGELSVQANSQEAT